MDRGVIKMISKKWGSLACLFVVSLLTACSSLEPNDIHQTQSVTTDLSDISVETALTAITHVSDGKGSYKDDHFEMNGTFLNDKLIDGVLILYYTDSTVTFSVKDEEIDFDHVSVSFEDGENYKGQWEDGISGKGTLTFKNGDSYEGDFKNGKMNGNGTYCWKDQACYTGSWKEDQMNGNGTYFYDADQTEYLSGTFRDNKPYGKATYFCENHKYTTTWSDGVCTKISYE